MIRHSEKAQSCQYLKQTEWLEKCSLQKYNNPTPSGQLNFFFSWILPWRLEGESVAAGVAHAVQVGVAGKLDHGRRSTHQDEGVLTRGRQVVPHHVLTDEALAVVPVCRSTRQIVVKKPCQDEATHIYTLKNVLDVLWFFILLLSIIVMMMINLIYIVPFCIQSASH